MKNFVFAVFLILGGLGSTLYYFWNQATQLPAWYRENESKSRSIADIQKSTAGLEQKIQATLQATPESSPKPSSQPKQPAQVALNSQELNDLLITKVTEKAGGKTLPSMVKGFHTVVKQDTLKTGAVVDIKELESSNIGTQEKEFLSQVSETLPLNDQKVYIGVEGKPQIQNGQLKFNENAKVQVGNLSFSLKEISDRLGISPQQLQERLNVELKLRNLNVKDIEFKDGNAILHAAPKEAVRP